ncbi:hypothetical protein Ddye_022207 [Dipteronia dyeriana]|uniref:Uncharacterized protein n=1 Tax=Dipteronia dyeriana TaxID=168575 RepID=A0AAD9WYF2_9ROSI|nr:hypothetical protein Ddye_022207 [Dipteronia dyeriana]
MFSLPNMQFPAIKLPVAFDCLDCFYRAINHFASNPVNNAGTNRGIQYENIQAKGFMLAVSLSLSLSWFVEALEQKPVTLETDLRAMLLLDEVIVIYSFG